MRALSLSLLLLYLPLFVDRDEYDLYDFNDDIPSPSVMVKGTHPPKASATNKGLRNIDDMNDGMNKKHDWVPSMVSFLNEVLSQVDVIDLTSRPLDPYLPLSLFIELERQRESREGFNEFQQVLSILHMMGGGGCCDLFLDSFFF